MQNKPVILLSLLLALFLILIVSIQASAYDAMTQVPYTDIAVTKITINPKNPELGDKVEAEITIKNLGDVTAGVTYVYGVSGPGWGFGSSNRPYCLELEPDEEYIVRMSFIASDVGGYRINARIVGVFIHDTNVKNNRRELVFNVD